MSANAKQLFLPLSSIPVLTDNGPVTDHASMIKNGLATTPGLDSLWDEFDEECSRRGGKDGCESCKSCYLVIF